MNISQMAGTSPVTLKAQYSEAIATGNTGTVIVQAQFGTAFTPISATGFVGSIGGATATLDVQVSGASILTGTITLAADSAVAGTVTSGTTIADSTDVSFIFNNASGGNITEAQGTITGYVTHTS